MSIVSEFREFTARGNVVDLAVGVIIGAAFGKIVTSFVEDIVMAPVGLVTGNINFSDRFLTLNGTHFDTMKAAKDAGAPTLYYGNFLTNIVSFFVVAFSVFLMVRVLNSRHKAEPVAEVAAPEDVVLLREIRDLLARR